jgi:stage II sporulation protein D
MPPSWPAEALKAQAIASRSYAVYRLHPSDGQFDLYDDTRTQVYRGVEARRPPRRGDRGDGGASAEERRGGRERDVPLDRRRCDREQRVRLRVAERGDRRDTGLVPAGLAGPGADGTAYDAASPYATWATAAYSRSALDAIFNADSRTAAGSGIRLDLSHRGVSGRLISVTLTGSLGSKTVSGDVFRSVFNARKPSSDPEMRSTLVDTRPIP